VKNKSDTFQPANSKIKKTIAELTPLDKQTKALLQKINEHPGPPMHELSIPEVRQMLGAMSDTLAGPRAEVHEIEDRIIPGPGGDLPIRIYYPPGSTPGKALPGALYFHGGGYHFGNLDSHDHVSRYMCANAGVIIIAVHYRLAPEHKFPAGVEDCYAALCWVALESAEIGVDRERLAVVGDSVGGTLVVTTCMLARDRGGPDIRFQAALFGLYDLGDGKEFPSRAELGTGEYFVSEETVSHIREQYLTDPEKEVNDPLVSPIRADDFSNLPPALVMVSEYDPARDENKAYADKLAAAGVPVEYKCFMGTIHGFFLFDGVLDVGKEGKKLVADRLRKALSS
jgi:acetyl esterase